MGHIRKKHKTDIEGSKQKRELLNMRYYHGYKGLRFIKKRDNNQEYSNFEQIQSIHKFDNDLKRIFYPCLIQI